MPSAPSAAGEANGSGGRCAVAANGKEPPWIPSAEVAAQEGKLRRNDFVSALHLSEQERIAALEALDLEVGTLEACFRKERRDLERRFEASYSPIFSRRAALVECLAADQAANGKNASVEDAGASLGDFWLRAMKASVAISSNVTAKDEAALKSIRNIVCRTLTESDGIGFKLEFHFAPNTYFTNSVLSKTYHMADQDVEPVLEKVVGTEINWKPGKDLTIKMRKSRRKDDSTDQMRVTAARSFFHYFATPRLPDQAEKGAKEFERCVTGIEADYEVGLALKEKVVPHAVRWFTGEAMDDEDYEDDGSDDRDDDDEDEELDGDELFDEVNISISTDFNDGGFGTSALSGAAKSTSSGYAAADFSQSPILAALAAPPKRTGCRSVGDGGAGPWSERLPAPPEAAPPGTRSR